MDADEPQGSGDVRTDIAKGLEGALKPAQIEKLIDEILAIQKGARGWCPNCNRNVQVQIPDAKGVTSALTELMNQSWGRPTDSKVETEIIVNRQVILVADTEEEPDGIAGHVEPAGPAHQGG